MPLIQHKNPLAKRKLVREKINSLSLKKLLSNFLILFFDYRGSWLSWNLVGNTSQVRLAFIFRNNEFATLRVGGGESFLNLENYF